MPKRRSSRDSTETNQPAAVVRDGPLKCVLWRNQGEDGPWYAAQLTRVFKTEAGYQETGSIAANDLLRVSFLAQQAYAELLALKAADRAQANHQPEASDEGPDPF